MKTSSAICLSLILGISFVANTNAAKQNFARSKPHASAANTVDNNCDGKKANTAQSPRCVNLAPQHKFKATTTRAMDHNASRSNTTSRSSATDHNSSRSNKTSSSRATDHNSSRSNKTSSSRATDYNSSRSNKQGINQNGDDLVLRKRPGRTQFTPLTNCPTAKKGENKKVILNCPAKKQ
jgi:hypothetical protein